MTAEQPLASSPNDPPELTVLIAADDPVHVAALTDMIVYLRPGVHIATLGQDAGEDFAREARTEFALVVEPSGERFGQLSRRVRAEYAGISLVMISPGFDERALEIVAGLGATAIVPSPCQPLAVLHVIDTLERKVRFPGRCGAMDTSELLRLHAAANSNGILHLAGQGRSGAIHLEDGHPVHAHCGSQRGVDAVRALLEWTNVDATWIDGRSAGTRTIVGRIEGLLERELGHEQSQHAVSNDAPEDVLRRLEHLAGIEDILGAYLLRDAEVVMGHHDSSLDEVLISRALSHLARVFHDMEQQQGDRASAEIQAMVGEHRLVVDRVGPARLGFQVGVIVRQATPVCKSLRRLLRQLDRAFRRALATSERGSGGGSLPGGSRQAAGLNQVA